jgi:hypothetical protein
MIKMMWSRLCVLALVAVSGGCGFGEGTGTLGGTLYVRGCNQDSDFGSLASPAGFNLSPIFFEGDPIDSPAYERLHHPVNHLDIRVQGHGLRENLADVLVVSISDEAPVAAAVGTPLALGPATDVRTSLKLNETCRYAEAGIELDGTITFSAFGSATKGGAVPANFAVGYNDRVAATLTVDVVDRRAATLGGVGPVSTTPAVAGQLNGSFDFIVRPGRDNPQF